MPSRDWTIAQQDQLLSEAIERDEPRLRSFIRKRVADAAEAEDILQEVFYELLSAYRLMQPVEQVSAWLFRVARNRITDLFRRRKTESMSATVVEAEDGSQLLLEEMLPSADAGPEEAYARTVLLEALDEALDELPAEQREVFIAHELMGISFKDLSASSGVGVNTLLSRKRYAVSHLRRRLENIYHDFTPE